MGDVSYFDKCENYTRLRSKYLAYWITFIITKVSVFLFVIPFAITCYSLHEFHFASCDSVDIVCSYCSYFTSVA